MSDRDEDLAATLALRRSLVSDDRQRHNRVLVERLADGFGHRARVQPILQRYEERGQLSPRQARAGQRVYEAYALGIVGARDAEPTGNGADMDGYAVAQLQAAEEYRRARDACGGRLWPIVWAVAIEDWSAARWANERGGGMNPAGAMALLRVGLDMISDCLGDV